MMNPVSSVAIAILIERSARLVHSHGFAQGLSPAQWVALRYFSEAPPYRTAADLARYQLLGIAPVARTVGLLVEKGLLYRVGGPLGRRASLLAVTPRGRELLRHDPYTAVVSVVETMPTDQRTVLATTFELLIPSLYAQHPGDNGDAADREASGEQLSPHYRGSQSSGLMEARHTK